MTNLHLEVYFGIMEHLVSVIQISSMLRKVDLLL